jgi:hypothetical protein
MAAHNLDEATLRETLKIWKDAGCVCAEAARRAGVTRPTFAHRLSQARVRFKLGNGPLVAPVPVPPGMKAGKRTVAYDAAGNVVAEWRRLYPEADALQAFVDQLCKQVAGKAPKPPPRRELGGDGLLLGVPIFDPHFGKYCWAPETGTDFDSATAERMVVGVVEQAAAAVRPCARALLILGGDTFHADSRHNQTERGGHVLDVDTRQSKVWEIATRAVVRSVELLASKAQVIDIAVIPGNHDWESSYHLQRLLAAWYREHADRVRVIQSPRSRVYVEHGCVLLGLAHGHLIKMADLPLLMAQEQADAWARTTERMWLLGHLHKKLATRWISADTWNGVQVEHMESLAGTDAWHAEMGFVGAPRRVECFLWDAVSGLQQRIYCHGPQKSGK